MATAHDVACYILDRQGPMSAIKLQKLVYYSQAWHLVWDEAPLFDDEIEAWANGPVVRSLYAAHRGSFTVAKSDFSQGDLERLTDSERESINAVLAYYGKFGAHQLSELTHGEAPWRDARGDLPPGVRGSAIITHGAMAEYYDSLTTADIE